MSARTPGTAPLPACGHPLFSRRRRGEGVRSCFLPLSRSQRGRGLGRGGASWQRFRLVRLIAAKLPGVLALGTVMLVASILMLTLAEILRRRAERRTQMAFTLP